MNQRWAVCDARRVVPLNKGGKALRTREPSMDFLSASLVAAAGAVAGKSNSSEMLPCVWFIVLTRAMQHTKTSGDALFGVLWFLVLDGWLFTHHCAV